MSPSAPRLPSRCPGGAARFEGTGPLGRSREAGLGLALLLVVSHLLTGSALAGTPAEGAAAPAEAPVFARIERAWRSGSAAAVVNTMAAGRETRLTLLAYPLSGRACSMKPEQARASLKAYFHRIAGVQLKDTTPPDSPATVRLYEYTYKPAREDTRTTRLHLQLSPDRKGAWVLASVTESAKPRD